MLIHTNLHTYLWLSSIGVELVPAGGSVAWIQSSVAIWMHWSTEEKRGDEGREHKRGGKSEIAGRETKGERTKLVKGTSRTGQEERSHVQRNK